MTTDCADSVIPFFWGDTRFFKFVSERDTKAKPFEKQVGILKNQRFMFLSLLLHGVVCVAENCSMHRMATSAAMQATVNWMETVSLTC